MDLDDLINSPGPRKPLLTVGEAHAALAMLRSVADGAGPDAAAAEELIVRLPQRAAEADDRGLGRVGEVLLEAMLRIVGGAACR
ncbi:hypothetical protein GLX30_00035 [Streptomyces sp. Tu 2975]|uniref:hypothetical protein n=1 Tax=Streptomyces sp. Tu 2975 TaxID=2676871 RepID=UPI0013568A2D|nr:hypothetical protein [Streptomyces sp. Tu 2975]QIP82735.1 hypothetical protein GLX30_00035 [Streptomyces sp. Tu 2975]